ncbi:helix-turn-helix domain-containing protein [Clostridium perfringens]|uniref:helix-turn-helix domain-containing protein n=1 Tax=Clostridium perfringens TaxID=1502 RepID=UPI001094CCB0|nr:helix-turn-helix transcriptional regulator [Clostridium perfringens]MDK0651532.1 helix-turn-helix transcriptional regulator [Clostridium perfringens]MDM0627425.1 helix-turn-helix transcriptional regulator [Clostridium perfringens]TGY43042.1 XRE family transcriptional regulator [Clostridium perfringens]
MRLRLRDLREDNEYTQQMLADYLNCDQSLYSKYERFERDIPIGLLEKLSTLYDTSIDYIVGITNIKTKYPKNNIYNK